MGLLPCLSLPYNYLNHNHSWRQGLSSFSIFTLVASFSLLLLYLICCRGVGLTLLSTTRLRRPCQVGGGLCTIPKAEKTRQRRKTNTPRETSSRNLLLDPVDFCRHEDGRVCDRTEKTGGRRNITAMRASATSFSAFKAATAVGCLLAAAASLLPTATAQVATQQADDDATIVGTWSTGSAAVTTGLVSWTSLLHKRREGADRVLRFE